MVAVYLDGNRSQNEAIAAELKEKLITTGIEEIRTKVSINYLCERLLKNVGVTHGAPYKHFENKNVYLQAVLRASI